MITNILLGAILFTLISFFVFFFFRVGEFLKRNSDQYPILGREPDQNLSPNINKWEDHKAHIEAYNIAVNYKESKSTVYSQKNDIDAIMGGKIVDPFD